jgi:hypothetical protein
VLGNCGKRPKTRARRLSPLVPSSRPARPRLSPAIQKCCDFRGIWVRSGRIELPQSFDHQNLNLGVGGGIVSSYLMLPERLLQSLSPAIENACCLAGLGGDKCSVHVRREVQSSAR